LNDLLKGVRYQKRINLGKFLRLNISKTGIGLSVGVRGLRYSIGPSGNYLSVGLPGSGIRYQRRVGAGGGLRFARLKNLLPGQSEPAEALQAAEAKSAAVDVPPLEKPGLFAPGWEKDLYKGVEAYYEADFPGAVEHLARSQDNPEADPALAVLLAYLLAERDQPGDRTTAIALLERAMSWEEAFPTPAMERYLLALPMEIDITPQVTITLPIVDGLATTLRLVELYQAEGEVEQAIDLLEEMDDLISESDNEAGDHLIKLSLFELYFLTKNYGAIMQQAQAPETIEDDITLGIMFFYGRALQEQNLHDAAIQVFTNCLRRRKGLNPTLQQACRLWRAMSYLKANQKARARKELERTLAEAPSDDIKRAGRQVLQSFWPDEYSNLA
jgi:tetratricopeptide (TPR) repeat protein